MSEHARALPCGARAAAARALPLLLALAAAGAARGDESSPSEGVTGDWGGTRSRLYQRGVDLQLSYFAEPAYNVTDRKSVV